MRPSDTEFEEGWMARQEGRHLIDNPYPLETRQHQTWADGWMEADRQNAEEAGSK